MKARRKLKTWNRPSATVRKSARWAGESKRASTVIVSQLYTFEMARIVFIQVKGIEKAIAIEADKVEVQRGDGTLENPSLIKISNKGQPVGEFIHHNVDGWWLTD
jgi:cytochrome c1